MMNCFGYLYPRIYIFHNGKSAKRIVLAIKHRPFVWVISAAGAIERVQKTEANGLCVV